MKATVVRNARVTIRAFDLVQNQDVEIRARGYIAIVLQHELDHMDGILFYDHINKKNQTNQLKVPLFYSETSFFFIEECYNVGE